MDWKERPGHSLAWDFASLIGWPVLLALLLLGNWPVLLAPAVLISYIGAFRGSISSWIFSRPIITVIGGMCYSMYLLHNAVLSVTSRLARQVLMGSNFASRFTVDAIIGIPAVLAVTITYFVLLERPCMDPAWPSKLRKRARLPVSVSLL